ncbi:YL1-domain-containing protein [Calocera cornea HHB12733]|uniref:YL1-domain-containing protein n=1 Tax=Calocera cornea HHB12733 TaxID=1353952 RepID=A0A165GW22_9BASI|nr:YL1-domain-containing protein [Calocera cornea HHB12733]
MSSPPLVVQRERRANAGNRMRALLDIEFEAEEMFAEEENDIEFISQDEEDDVFESDFVSTEDEPDEDEEAEERAVLREEKVKRAAARKKADRTTTTSLFVPKPAAKAPAEQRAKPVKRVSIALPPDTRSINILDNSYPLRRRQSARSSTRTAKLKLERKLKEDAARRASVVSRPKRPIQPRKTQDQLIADALELEERNVKSLKDFLAREEEKKRTARVVRKTVHDGGVVAFISRAEEVRIPPVQVIEPTVAPMEMLLPLPAFPSSAATQVMKLEQIAEECQATMKEQPLSLAGSGVPEPRKSPSAPQPEKPGGSPDVGESGQALPADVDVASLTTPQRADADDVEEVQPIPLAATTPHEPAERLPSPKEEVDQSVGVEVIPEATTSRSLGEPSFAVASSESASTEERFLQTRNLVALKDLIPEDLAMEEDGDNEMQKSKTKVPWTWVEEMTALFGDHVDWGSLKVVPARNRPIYRRPPMCPMTGLPAPYRDPQTGIPYANAKAYRTLQRLTDHQFVWSEGRGVYWADEREQGARGVPASWNGYVRGIMPGQRAQMKPDVDMEDAASAT